MYFCRNTKLASPKKLYDNLGKGTLPNVRTPCQNSFRSTRISLEICWEICEGCAHDDSMHWNVNLPFTFFIVGSPECLLNTTFFHLKSKNQRSHLLSLLSNSCCVNRANCISQIRSESGTKPQSNSFHILNLISFHALHLQTAVN